MGACIEKQFDMSHVVKSGLDNKMLHKNREFLKQAERPAEQPKPVEGSDSQSLKRMKASL